MKYRKLLYRFWDFNKMNKIGSTAISMYLLLLNKSVENKILDFKLSDVAIANELNITRKTVKVIKLKLQNLGLISFKSKNGVACNFRIITDYSINDLNKTNIKSHKPENKSQVKILKQANKVNENPVSDRVKSKISRTGKIVNKSENFNLPIIIDAKEIKKNIPTLNEFMDYFKSLELYEVGLELVIIEKYNSWIENDWKNASNRPINNWQTALKSLLPYLKTSSEKIINSKQSLPNIKQPILPTVIKL